MVYLGPLKHAISMTAEVSMNAKHLHGHCTAPPLPAACRVVDLGPFKHTIDDGLELRKASFECMDTLLERCGDRVEPETFVSHLLHGLKVGGEGRRGLCRVGGVGE